MKILLTQNRLEWKHKERVWWGLYQYSPLESLESRKFAEEKAMELETWLDWQCKGGWEGFEIKGGWEGQEKWGLFRRLVE
mgnify:CR=1 FL=1